MYYTNYFWVVKVAQLASVAPLGCVCNTIINIDSTVTGVGALGVLVVFK